MRHQDDRDTRVRVASEGARLLQDHRARTQPPPGAADASWLALTRRIAAGESGPLDDQDDAGDAQDGRPDRGAPGWRWVIAAVAVAAALALWQLAPGLAGRDEGAAGHAASLLQLDPGDPRSAASPGERGGGPSGQVLKYMLKKMDDDMHDDDPAPQEVGASAHPDSRAIDRRPVPQDNRPSEPAAALGSELALVRAAAEALRVGQGSRALTRAEEYLRAHPKGVFVPEARLHRAEALCLLGRAEDAREASAAFVRELPDSPLRARITAVCAP